MSKNIVVVYGSGASYASGYKVKIKKKGGEVYKEINPPMDQMFFDEIHDDFLKEKYYALWKFKNILFGSNSTVGMEEIWTAIDLNHKHITLDTYHWQEETEEYKQESKRSRFVQCNTMEGDLMAVDVLSYPSMDINPPFLNSFPTYNKYKFLGDCGRDFRGLIYDVYSDYTASPQQDCYKCFHELLESSGSNSISYITFNYDCCLENSLKSLRKKFKYIHSNFNTESIDTLLDGGVPIIKLHGSLSWEHGSNDRIIQYENIKQVKPNYCTPEWIQPAIIPPTIFKQEINDDSRKADPLTCLILQQWKASITILTNADKIIFGSFSLQVGNPTLL